MYLYNDYEETMFELAACLAVMRLRRIFNKALFAEIGRLAAEEVGNTWLGHEQQYISLSSIVNNDSNSTGSTTSADHQPPWIRQGPRRGRGGYGRRFQSLLSCRSMRIPRRSLRQTGPSVVQMSEPLSNKTHINGPELQRKLWTQW